jgi:hypothetical protein
MINKILKPKNKIDNIILRILKNEVSEFEIITEINAITTDETFNLFCSEFQSRFYIISMEFYFSLDNKSIIKAVQEAKKTGIPLPYYQLSEDEINHIKPFIKKVENIDCFFNAFGIGNSKNTTVKEFLFLNELMIDYDPVYQFTGEDKEFDDVYNLFGNLKFLNKIFKYLNNKNPEQNKPLVFSAIPMIKFQNNFDRVLESTIFEYFKTKLVDKRYITESILNDYLNLAFDKQTPPKQKFSFEKLNTQNDIIQIFYN